jgi:hypothetical protein
MKSIPGFLKKYFWDVDFLKLDKNKHSYFIIERILEYGDKKALKWLKENFEEKAIKNVLLTSKNLSPKTANFWQLIFGLNKDKILCLKKSFRKKQKLIWKH